MRQLTTIIIAATFLVACGSKDDGDVSNSEFNESFVQKTDFKEHLGDLLINYCKLAKTCSTYDSDLKNFECKKSELAELRDIYIHCDEGGISATLQSPACGAINICKNGVMSCTEHMKKCKKK